MMHGKQYGNHSLQFALRSARRRQEAERTVGAWTSAADDKQEMIQVCDFVP